MNALLAGRREEELRRAARDHGPQGRRLVRPAAMLASPHDVLDLRFNGPMLSAAPPNTASSAELVVDPPVPLAPYTLLWTELQSFDLDDPTLGGLFVAYLSLTLDDDSVVDLGGLEADCAVAGATSFSGPFFDEAESIGLTRALKGARLNLSAAYPGSATATMSVASVYLYLFRSHPLPTRNIFP